MDDLHNPEFSLLPLTTKPVTVLHTCGSGETESFKHMSISQLLLACWCVHPKRFLSCNTTTRGFASESSVDESSLLALRNSSHAQMYPRTFSRFYLAETTDMGCVGCPTYTTKSNPNRGASRRSPTIYLLVLVTLPHSSHSTFSRLVIVACGTKGFKTISHPRSRGCLLFRRSKNRINVVHTIQACTKTCTHGQILRAHKRHNHARVGKF